jgi:hypothetical protein
MNTGIEAPKTYSIIVTERHQASRERRDLLASFGAVQRHANARVVGTSERHYASAPSIVRGRRT